MYEIEKGVSIPRKYSTRAVGYPFDQMTVGDSFFVSMEEFKDYKGFPKVTPAMSNTIRSAAKRWGQRGDGAGEEFTVRTVRGSGAIIGFRCWRLK